MRRCRTSQMRLRWPLILGFLMLGAVTSGTASAEECSGTITAEDALRAEDTRYAAQIANDFAALERIFGEDLVYVRSSDGAVADKHALLESMRSGALKFRAMRRSDIRVRTYGCLATITGFVEQDLTARGQELSEEVRFHSLWVRRDQGLQFVSWQTTRIPPK